MAGPASTFRELHRLRRLIRDLTTEIDRAPRSLKIQQTKLANQEAAFKDAQEAIKKLKIGTHDKEVSLKVAHGQIAKYEKQQQEVGNSKEYEAFASEIKHARTKADELENAILEALSATEEAVANLPKVEATAKQAQATYTEFVAGQGDKLKLWASEKTNAEIEVKRLETTLPIDIGPLYHRLVASFGPDAMASVVKNVCQHCRTELTAQQASVLTTEAYVQCKSCGRALYQAM